MTESPTASTSKCHDDKSDKSEKAVFLQIQEINSQVAQFRDLLINVGQPRDCPELREKIRKLRRTCVEACKATSQLVLPQVRSSVAAAAAAAAAAATAMTMMTISIIITILSAMDVGIPADSPNLVLLFFVTQLFLRELSKCKNLVRIIPMDMSGYYGKILRSLIEGLFSLFILLWYLLLDIFLESRAGPSNIGNVISQILLCKQITPDFNEEELCSIKKDSAEIGTLIADLQEFMPQSEADTGSLLFCFSEKCVALQEAGNRVSRNNGGRKVNRWNASNRSRQSSYCRGGFKFLCCTARTNYI
ncbi:hypothetical protein M0802_008225 [Mischocyttarus mexicanus]|nr:hypothetical protein M0802_008225 [Mischocyttarus mexicanus]